MIEMIALTLPVNLPLLIKRKGEKGDFYD